MANWLITGGSSGFGLLMVKKLLARGDRVAAVSRRLAPLDELKALYGDRLWTASLDLVDVAATREVIGRAFAELGTISVLVSNAGYGAFGGAEELSDEQVRRQIHTNLIGSIQVIRAALPLMRAQGGGRIIQVSSEGGQIAYPGFSLYHASKWGIEGFVEAVAQEVASFGIEFTIAEPGPTDTGFRDSMDLAPSMAAYEGTPVAAIREGMRSGEFARPGDPVKIAQAMIESADVSPAPLRLVFGRESHDRVRAALVARLNALDSQRDLAATTDLDG